MFGRKKTSPVDDSDLGEKVDEEDLAVYEAEEDADKTDGSPDDEPESDADDEADDEPDDEVDEWQALDASRDWREDGPFDISEVDLDADDVQRIDFGTLIVTPFDDMQLQLQVSQANGQVQALMVVDKKSALEVALFAAPARGSMLGQVRDEMAAATDKAGGTMTLEKGPLGTQIRRVLPGKASDGREIKQRSLTWLAQGPKWLLRGVLMGQAVNSDKSGDDAQLLFEFFCNLVVRRGDTPKVPGELIGMEIPASLAANLPNQPK
ncbi:MAG: DUF3710 domain-containing protein [Propionibacteriaceae bacterium]|nr:DUF3710 domain-containing protein [Propionibacteriaceae bacterium]